MRVLITNDDGYFARGIKTMARHIAQLHDVFIVAPQTEQSGISQAITFLRPLNPCPVVDKQGHLRGYSVNGTPADCVKLGIHELAPWKPDLIVSGINFGLNVGVNVGHSGTVGGALTASVFDVPAVAVSVEGSDGANFQLAAEIAWEIIESLDWPSLPARSVVNINIPASVQNKDYQIATVPVETNPLGYHYQKGTDPKNRQFFWATNAPAPEKSPFETDTEAVRLGKVTVSAISCNPNHAAGQAALGQQLNSAHGVPGRT